MGHLSRISITCALLLVSLFGVTGQEIKISREIGIRNEFVYEVLPNMNGNILVYRDRGQQFFFDIFDSNLNFQRTAEINFDQKRVNIMRVVPIDSVVHIYYNYFVQDTFCFSRRVYAYDATFLKQDTLLRINRDEVKDKVRSTISEDNSKFAIFSIGENLLTAIFEVKSGIMLYQNKLILKDIGEKDEFRNFTIANDGNIFLLFEKDNGTGDKNHHFNLVKTVDPSAYSLHRIAMPKKFSSGVKFSLDNYNKRIAIAGLYSEKYENETTGYYTLNKKISNLTSDESFEYSEYDESLVKEMYGKVKGKEKVIRDHSLRELFWRADGGLVLITEMQKEYVRRNGLANAIPSLGPSSSQYSNRSLVDYYHEDMMVFSIHPDGKLHWREILYKKQFSQDDDGAFSSFFVYKTPSRVHIVYNDEIKNNNTISEYVIDPLGKFERNTILNTDYQGLKLRFQDAIQISSKAFIVPSEKNYKLSLVKVVF